jgi:hypothetical protein
MSTILLPDGTRIVDSLHVRRVASLLPEAVGRCFPLLPKAFVTDASGASWYQYRGEGQRGLSACALVLKQASHLQCSESSVGDWFHVRVLVGR